MEKALRQAGVTSVSSSPPSAVGQPKQATGPPGLQVAGASTARKPLLGTCNTPPLHRFSCPCNLENGSPLPLQVGYIFHCAFMMRQEEPAEECKVGWCLRGASM